MRSPRRPRPTFHALLAATLVLGVACSGGGASPAAVSSPTVAPATTAPATSAPVATTAPAPTASASPSATAAPPQAGVGSASVKLSEAKLVAGATPVHVGFIGDEPGLPAGSYMEVLNLVTLQPGGRTVSHKHGGLEIVVVTEGSLEVRMPAGAKVMLTAGQTAKVPANTPVQAVNAGSTVARFLAFFITADGQPFQTNLDTVP